MSRVVDTIYHPDGSKTLVYDDGSRELYLRTIDIIGRVPGTAGATGDDDGSPPPDLIPAPPSSSAPPPPEQATQRPESGSRAAQQERATTSIERGTDARARQRQAIDPDTAPPVARPLGPLGRPERVYPDITAGDRARLADLQRALMDEVRARLGSRRELHSQEVFAIVEIRDRSGQNPQRSFGANGRSGHAEQAVVRRLEPYMADERYRGGSLMMIVTQEPCGPGQVPVRHNFCQLEIRRFSRRHGLYTQVYVPIDPANLMRTANPSFRRFLRSDDVGAALPVARSESDTWDDRPPPPPPPRGSGQRGRGPRTSVPAGPTQADIDAARTRAGLLAHTHQSVQRAQSFGRVLRAQTAVLNGLMDFASLLDAMHRSSELVNDGRFAERAQIEDGARAWNLRAVDAARRARADAITTQQLDEIQGALNDAFNRRDAQSLADLADQLFAWERSLTDTLARLERLQAGCDSASHSLTVANRMFRQMFTVSALDDSAQADWFILWHSTYGIADIYRRAAAQYFYAVNDTRRSLEALRPLADDAQLVLNQSLGRALTEIEQQLPPHEDRPRTARPRSGRPTSQRPPP